MTNLEVNGCTVTVNDQGRVLWLSDPARTVELVSAGVLNAVKLDHQGQDDRVYFDLFLVPIRVRKAMLQVSL